MNKRCNEVLDNFNVLMRFVKSEMKRLKIFGAFIPRNIFGASLSERGQLQARENESYANKTDI